MKHQHSTNCIDLARFVDAQADDFNDACRELRSGRKTGHWIWYIFPQMKGLGVSTTSEFYSITSLVEAKAYLAHPVLGPRLVEATQLVLGNNGRTLRQIFGTPDDLKFRSCMTLFECAADRDNTFGKALDKFCDGQRDIKTLTLLEPKHV
jgi:uncharacterized protein (DUF1810 family)